MRLWRNLSLRWRGRCSAVGQGDVAGFADSLFANPDGTAGVHSGRGDDNACDRVALFDDFMGEFFAHDLEILKNFWFQGFDNQVFGCFVAFGPSELDSAQHHPCWGVDNGGEGNWSAFVGEYFQGAAAGSGGGLEAHSDREGNLLAFFEAGFVDLCVLATACQPDIGDARIFFGSAGEFKVEEGLIFAGIVLDQYVVPLDAGSLVGACFKFPLGVDWHFYKPGFGCEVWIGGLGCDQKAEGNEANYRFAGFGDDVCGVARNVGIHVRAFFLPNG